MRTFDADYISRNNHRKHAERSNNCVSMPIHVFSHVRNDSDIRWILRMRQPCVIWVDISQQNALDQSGSLKGFNGLMKACSE